MLTKGCFVLSLAATGAVIQAQQPLAPRAASGQSVTPVYEGWYANPDGTYSLSFGYFNRNTKEIIEIPLGANNTLSLAEAPQNQPTVFHPGRHWGVFVVTVPRGFDRSKRVTWTLRHRGETLAIPGRLHVDWQIDALEGEASVGNTPPALRFAESGPEGRGPGGLMSEPMQGRVGVPLTVPVWVKDDGKGASNVVAQGADGAPVTLTWFKHQGPGEVAFTPATARVGSINGTMKAMAVFSAPGDYILRVRANDASGVMSGGHAQCCWTNGFVRVIIAP